MDRDRLQSGLQIASNLGLLVGLVLVGIQIQQASDLTRRTLLVASFQSETDHLDALLGDNAAAVVARAETEPESLTPADLWVLQAYSQWHFSMMRRNAQLESYGMMSSEWRALLPILGAHLASNPVTRELLLEGADPIAQAAGHDWMKVMQDEARRTPPDAGKRFVEHLLRVAKASGRPAGAEPSAPGQEP